FKKDDDVYVLSFYVSGTIKDYETIEYEVVCKDRKDSSNSTVYTGTFYAGFGDANSVTSDADIEVSNASPVYLFEDDVRQCTLNFENDCYYKANFRDDIELSLYYSTELIDSIVNNNDASIEFTNFTARPTFDLEGVFYYYAPNFKYLYDYSDGELKLMSTTKTGDYFRFTTRTLGFYIVSDKPLKNATTSSSTDSSSSSLGSAFQDVSSSSSKASSVVASSSKAPAASSSSKAVAAASTSKPAASSSSSTAAASSSSSSAVISSSSAASSSSSASSSTSIESSSSSSEQPASAQPEPSRKNGSNIILIIGAVIATIGVVSLTAALLTKKK
ncbi:MAG TPA: hypothetical protein DCP97_03560, partial [Ruminococcaceae bacterium]|nr:hypothetical protein [Oscillospiraceae bacterium]